MARNIDVDPGVMTFYRAPIILNQEGLAAITATVVSDGYGFVLISSWQAVVRGLIRDENDNAGAVRVINSAGLSGIRRVEPRRREELIALLRSQAFIAVRDRASSRRDHGLGHR